MPFRPKTWQQDCCCSPLFETAMATTTPDVEMSENREHNKGKGGVLNLKQGTTTHFEQKAKAAAEAESLVRKALASDDMDIDLETGGDILVQKTRMDSMEPEAHANTILATEFQHNNQFEDPELTGAPRRMALSDSSSWEDVGTEQSADTNRSTARAGSQRRKTPASHVPTTS